MTPVTFVAYASDEVNFVFLNEKEEILFAGSKEEIVHNYNLQDLKVEGYYVKDSTMYICVNSKQEDQYMGSKLKLLKCNHTKTDCVKRIEDGRCRILCNTEFKDNNCTFYKSKEMINHEI